MAEGGRGVEDDYSGDSEEFDDSDDDFGDYYMDNSDVDPFEDDIYPEGNAMSCIALFGAFFYELPFGGFS